MKTSYFSKYKGENGVSIAGGTPDWFKGCQYKKLAPKYWFFKKYKEDGDKSFYVEQYKKEILDKLNPQEVLEELGRDSVLLCWEKSGEFCHRHLVSEWLMENTEVGIIEEIK